MLVLHILSKKKNVSVTRKFCTIFLKKEKESQCIILCLLNFQRKLYSGHKKIK
jgi:hypothetical protein